MKKLLPSVTLAFASLASVAGFASAGTFGLFTGCHCCKDCGGTITLRQYNAFSPVACGSMMFQGCVVAPPPNPNPAPYGFDGGVGFGGYSGDCPDGSCGQGVPVGRMQYPAQNAFPVQGGMPMPGTYAYNQMMQMPQMQYPQMQYPQMQYPQVQYPQPQYTQMPQYYQMPQAPAAPLPASVTQPAGARLP